jgi:hypothetical protein
MMENLPQPALPGMHVPFPLDYRIDNSATFTGIDRMVDLNLRAAVDSIHTKMLRIITWRERRIYFCANHKCKLNLRQVRKLEHLKLYPAKQRRRRKIRLTRTERRQLATRCPRHGVRHNLIVEDELTLLGLKRRWVGPIR